ncbi:MAG: hypothetical protein VCB25_00360, partial [Myxococcota bacterium]
MSEVKSCPDPQEQRSDARAAARDPADIVDGPWAGAEEDRCEERGLDSDELSQDGVTGQDGEDVPSDVLIIIECRVATKEMPV